MSAVEALERCEGARVRVACLAREPELETSVREFLARAGEQATGPELERKLRVVRFARRSAGEVEVTLAPTTWELGRGFHLAVMARGVPEELASRWLVRALAGEPLTPGLAAVHGIARTRDGELVLARRSASAAYRPLHWAATLEEQMIADDLREEDALARALRRGLHEELGEAARGAEITFLTALVELETFNVAFLLAAQLRASAAELRESAACAPDAHETSALAFVSAEPNALRVLALSGAFAPLHPTSALRLEVLARYLESARP